jgi:hypothetical protein
VLVLILRQGLKLTLIGIGLGLLAAFALTRWMESLLFGVRPTDTLTFGMIAVALLLVALVACWLPARRATKVDPLIALRSEFYRRKIEYDNGARAVRLGIGRTMRREQYTAERAAVALQQLLDDPSYRERAAALGQRVQAEDGVRVACDAIEEQLNQVA